MEALALAVDPGTGDPIPNDLLFADAERVGLAVELDRLARKKAFAAYQEGIGRQGEPILFVNLSPSILNGAALGSSNFVRGVRERGLPVSRVAIEIIESRVSEDWRLVDFTERYRKEGFLIVLDDFGAAHSNLKRLITVKPDIVKIDRSVVSDLDRDHYKRSIVKSVIELCHMVGALCVAEGIERLEELIECYLLGADLMQGYYFGRPNPQLSASLAEARLRIEETSRTVEESARHASERDLRRFTEFRKIVERLSEALSREDTVAPEAVLRSFVDRHQQVACAYLIDGGGRQITATVTRETPSLRPSHPLFQPAPKGFDHSLKGYFVNLGARGEFFTDPYISLATGRRCRTFAKRFTSNRFREPIVCVDFEESS